MRSEFEKLPIIQEILTDESDGLMFDERFSKYLCSSSGNEEYLNGSWMVYKHRQTEVDDLQLKINRLIESEENIARGCEAWRNAHRQADERADEMQKRVDALTQTMEELLEEMKYPTATFEEVICSGVKELEQALKGGGE